MQGDKPPAKRNAAVLEHDILKTLSRGVLSNQRIESNKNRFIFVLRVS
jgi:hypothetical protein